LLNPEALRRQKEAAISLLEDCGGDPRKFYDKGIFTSNDIALWRQLDPFFNRKWEELKSQCKGKAEGIPQLKSKFLQWLRRGYTPGKACREIGVRIGTVREWRKDDPDFAISWEEADDEGSDFLEDELRRRAVEGIDKAVWYRGAKVGTETNYSDGLLMSLLQARKPARFKRYDEAPPSVNTTLNLQGDLSSLSPQELAERYRSTLTAINEGKK